jgi:hypothetical protein
MNLGKLDQKDILIVVGVLVAVLIGLSTHWALAGSQLLSIINIQN